MLPMPDHKSILLAIYDFNFNLFVSESSSNPTRQESVEYNGFTSFTAPNSAAIIQ